MSSRSRIIVTGLIAQHRLLGGVAWGVLNYVLGLVRLGYEVYYVEDSGQWPYNMDGGPDGRDWIARDCSPNVAHLAAVMSRFGLEDRWAYRFPIEPRWYGLSDARRSELLATADLLLNVSGTLEEPDRYRQIPRLVYIDTDPVFTQIEVSRGETGLKGRVDAHDVHFSFGECLSEPVPETGHRWQPTRTPDPPRAALTTVMNWTSYEPLVHDGRTYGQKDAEFVRFLELPERVAPTVLEVALPRLHHAKWAAGRAGLPAAVRELLERNPAWTPSELLAHHGWRVVDALEIGADFEQYRRYVQQSKAEWSIAKNGYVQGRSGWFSNRSATYLAAGRPVVVQDTGFTPVLPTGEGILVFRSPEEAAAGIRAVETDYTRHSRAARELAAEFFDSDKVLEDLIARATTTDD
jgi:hypothetical protein